MDISFSPSNCVANCFNPAAGDRIRPMFLVTSYVSLLLWTSFDLLCLLLMCNACRLHRMISTFFMASTDFCHKSRSYFTGTFLLFSNSNDGSIARSLPEDLRKALVHLVLRGFFFFLNAFLHLDRQNLKIFNKNLSQEVTMLDLIRRSHLAVISNKNHSVARPYI